MRVLFVSPEVHPLAKTGGLADACTGLVKALVHLGCDVRVLMPAYPKVLEHPAGPAVSETPLDVAHAAPISLLAGVIPDTGIPAWFVRCPQLYERSGGPYQDAQGCDWPDNDVRFGLFSRVAARIAEGHAVTGWQPDIVHLNDWTTGPAACVLGHRAGPRPRIVFTIHNMAFQGLFAPSALEAASLAHSAFTPDGIEFWGRVSYLKAGLRYADRVTTVSETYAREIMTTDFGCGLEGVLQARPDGVVGIRNGIDTTEWDSRTDRFLPARYSADDMRGKAVCKTAARRHFGLDLDDDAPLLVYASRLTGQKMADIVAAALPEIVARRSQVIVMGLGEPAIEAEFRRAAGLFPGRLGVHIGYDEGLAHRVFAGGDVLLAPARFEPCGLNQMYAMRYGTVPLVTRVGGLAETVTDASPHALASGSATGVVFDGVSVEALIAAVERALTLYRQDALWGALRRSGMRADWSWEKSARRYVDVYRDLLSTEPSRIPGTVRRADRHYRGQRRLRIDSPEGSTATRGLAARSAQGAVAGAGKRGR